MNQLYIQSYMNYIAMTCIPLAIQLSHVPTATVKRYIIAFKN